MRCAIILYFLAALVACSNLRRPRPRIGVSIPQSHIAHNDYGYYAPTDDSNEDDSDVAKRYPDEGTMQYYGSDPTLYSNMNYRREADPQFGMLLRGLGRGGKAKKNGKKGKQGNDDDDEASSRLADTMIKNLSKMGYTEIKKDCLIQNIARGKVGGGAATSFDGCWHRPGQPEKPKWMTNPAFKGGFFPSTATSRRKSRG